MMVNINPIKLTGNWIEGYALDIHTISSEFLGYDEFGHEVFDTKRSEMGELLYRIKYKSDKSSLKEQIMIKIFIGGSRDILKLNVDIKSRIDNIMQKGYTVLVGDANGVDKSVQIYLFGKNYKDVRIFCMGNECRNNIGHWEINHININGASKKKDYNYYSIKDMEMAREADYGFMVWDGKSKGTLNNIINLLKENKKALVYFSPSKEFFNLISFADFEKLLTKCEKKFLEIFEQKFKVSQISKKEQQLQHELNFL